MTTSQHLILSRRTLVKHLGWTPLILHHWASATLRHPEIGRSSITEDTSAFAFSDLRLSPRYPARSPLEDILRLVLPGSDEYRTEKYASDIQKELQNWSRFLSGGDFAGFSKSLHADLQASSFIPNREVKLRTDSSVTTSKREFSPNLLPGIETFLKGLRSWLGDGSHVERAGFEITSIRETSTAPLAAALTLRYDIVTSGASVNREQHTGTWSTEWMLEAPTAWKLRRLQAEEETLSVARGAVFVDVTHQALGSTPSYASQMAQGSDHWRSVLDGACGIDVYGNNGVAAGDFDGDGHDDLYVCQPAGLPNRLYRNRGDGTFEDVTEKAGVGVLDNTSCALFADFRNSGLQDLLVVCGSGPLLFLNQGNGTFQNKPDAFQFSGTPLGTFTHAAVADYDRDGRLDIYFCLYSYYLGLDQYHYPIPYFDARNGPPNFLLHNQGDGTFIDRTDAAGLHADNDRYSFACAWCESPSNNAPDLYVVNDFGRNVLYRNNGHGKFTVASTSARVEDVGAGMSACWADPNNDGRPDLYAANMWSAAGQRVSQQARFQTGASDGIRKLYQQHAEGNNLYENTGDGAFRNASMQAGVSMGRWAWCSDFWDFDHDGYADLYVTNGYITAQQSEADQGQDLGSFFWRQVVGKSPEDSTPSLAYEHGWNALNELIRSDHSWSGHERNVMFANNRDGTFSEVSGVAGLDFLEDGRSFALADLDGDGRLEVVVKNRSAPQLRILHTAMETIGESIAFRLRGTRSNRDGIGTSIAVEVGDLRQTKYLQAGSGFLAQHSKELFFGVGSSTGNIRATVRWPSGVTQHFEALPRNSRITLEEGSATFAVKPFALVPQAYTQATQPKVSAGERSSALNVETWLVDPLKAPAFSLPDLAGKPIALDSTRGGFALLQFWSQASATSRELLQAFQQSQTALASGQVKVLAINVDQAEAAKKARAFAESQRLAFPALFATEEVAGIYNIIYRYLFDRRRDLPIPCSFLLDQQGMIVKLYQGVVTPNRVLEDVRAIPSTPDERMRKALPFAGVAYKTDFVRNDFTYGVAMFQHGYLEQAAESFQQVVAARPNDAEAFYNLGTLHLRRNNFPQARVDLEKTLSLKPDYPEAWNNLGMMAAQEGHADEAIRNFQYSLQLRPGYAIALLNLGNVYRRQGDAANAKDALTRALSLQPDDPEANYSLGMLYAQQAQVPTAEEYLQKAVALRPDYPEALNNLGVLFVRKQAYGDAELQFKTCIRLAPTFDQSYLNLARLYILQKDKVKARGIIEDLLRLHPESAPGKQALEALDATP